MRYVGGVDEQGKAIDISDPGLPANGYSAPWQTVKKAQSCVTRRCWEWLKFSATISAAGGAVYVRKKPMTVYRHMARKRARRNMPSG